MSSALATLFSFIKTEPETVESGYSSSRSSSISVPQTSKTRTEELSSIKENDAVGKSKENKNQNKMVVGVEKRASIQTKMTDFEIKRASRLSVFPSPEQLRRSSAAEKIKKNLEKAKQVKAKKVQSPANSATSSPSITKIKSLHGVFAPFSSSPSSPTTARRQSVGVSKFVSASPEKNAKEKALRESIYYQIVKAEPKERVALVVSHQPVPEIASLVPAILLPPEVSLPVITAAPIANTDSFFAVRRSKRQSICVEKLSYDQKTTKKKKEKKGKNGSKADKEIAKQKKIKVHKETESKTEEIKTLDVNKKEELATVSTPADQTIVVVKPRRKSVYVEAINEPDVEPELFKKPGKKRKRESLEKTNGEMKQSAKRQKTSESEFEEGVVEEVIEDIWHADVVGKEPAARFLVKWDGFSPTENTYEPYEHVSHAECLQEYVRRKFELHQEKIEEAINKLLVETKDHYDLYISKPKSFIISKLAHFDALHYKCNILAFIYTYERIIPYSEFMRKLRYHSILYKFYLRVEEEKATNNVFLNKIMKKEKNQFVVKAQNLIDYETVPTFEYLRRVKFPKASIKIGCKCEGGCSKSSQCCPKLLDAEFVYDVDHRICALSHQMIVECNDACSCDATCINRPKAPTISFCIFKTTNRGWALKTLRSIPAGSFVIEYTGELIDQDEAQKRTRVYNKTGHTYLFDLDYNVRAEAMYSIDATKTGNLSRFINHSCEANLQTWPARSCNDDPNVHRLYYIALRQIRSGEELTVDYSGGVINPKMNPPKDATVCKCGSDICKGYIF